MRLKYELSIKNSLSLQVEKEFKDHLKDCRRLLGTLYTRNPNP